MPLKHKVKYPWPFSFIHPIDWNTNKVELLLWRTSTKKDAWKLAFHSLSPAEGDSETTGWDRSISKSSVLRVVFLTKLKVRELLYLDLPLPFVLHSSKVVHSAFQSYRKLSSTSSEESMPISSIMSISSMVSPSRFTNVELLDPVSMALSSDVWELRKNTKKKQKLRTEQSTAANTSLYRSSIYRICTATPLTRNWLWAVYNT